MLLGLLLSWQQNEYIKLCSDNHVFCLDLYKVSTQATNFTQINMETSHTKQTETRNLRPRTSSTVFNIIDF